MWDQQPSQWALGYFLPRNTPHLCTKIGQIFISLSMSVYRSRAIGLEGPGIAARDGPGPELSGRVRTVPRGSPSGGRCFKISPRTDIGAELCQASTRRRFQVCAILLVFHFIEFAALAHFCSLWGTFRGLCGGFSDFGRLLYFAENLVL